MEHIKQPGLLPEDFTRYWVDDGKDGAAGYKFGHYAGDGRPILDGYVYDSYLIAIINHFCHPKQQRIWANNKVVEALESVLKLAKGE